jgi:N-methylhydantoinase B
MFDRVSHPAKGRNGGQNGAAGSITLDDGTVMQPKGWQHVPEGRRLILQLPGGGGFGDPAKRQQDARTLDATRGYVTGAAK